jgi:alpha-L-fucosidase 2
VTRERRLYNRFAMRNALAIGLLTGWTLAAASPTLWYRQPAKNWNEALPIGNGRLGGMIFGGVAEEKIQLNEDTVWAGELRDRNNPAGHDALPEIRRLLFAGKPAEAEALADRTMIAIPRRMPPYQTLGDLMVRFTGVKDFRDYRRELDIDSAIARVVFRSGDGLYTREAFSSAPDQVIVIRLTCDKPGRISLRATLTREQDSITHTAAPGRVILQGEAIARDPRHEQERPVGMKFRGVLQALPDGGKMRVEDNDVVIEGADSVTLLIAAATNFRGQDPDSRTDRDLTAAARKPYAQLRAAHVADYQRYFHRVDLQLADATPDLPTDERLVRAGGGAADPQLAALYFQFGRYLLICSSRPGSMAANLQGIWNDQLAPSWDSKYTININTEMNYWPAEVTNLPEMHEPLFDLVDAALPDGRRVARNLYGASGFVIHHNTDIWGDAVPIDGVKSGVWPMGGAWLSLHFWDHYDFTRDRKFLALRAYPVMKEAAQFLLDYLVDDGKGRLVTGPSLSPENDYRTAGGVVARLTMGPYMDTEITYALFSRTIQAAEILSLDADFRRKLSAARDRLPAFQVGKHGQLQEWLEDYDEPQPGHRHVSHLFAVFPGNQITLRGTPELAKAARTSLERRLANGGGGTGWSRAWVINLWARFEAGDLAHESLMVLLGKSTLPNMLDTHPPFQIDGNFGGTSAIAEMLMQSQNGEIAILPALPKAWPEGSVKGLRARGGVDVSIDWKAGKTTRVALKAEAGGEFRVRLPEGKRVNVKLAPGKEQTVN